MLEFEKMMIPIWDTDFVYLESLMMVTKNGETCAPLLYHPKKIISVQSANLNETYEEGRDWFLNDDKIYLTDNSRIFHFDFDELYPQVQIKGGSFPKEGGGYVLFSEGHFFHDRQIAVSYICEEGSWIGVMPQYAGAQLPRTMEKLKKEKCLNLVLYGDSISEGSNASGITISEPFQPIWGDLLAENLRRQYNATVRFSNPSLGGMNSDWGIKNADALVNPNQPDLVIIAFGMNDGVNGEQFAEKIKMIMSIVKEKNPKAEFILAATSLPNPLLTTEKCRFYKNQYEYKDALETLCKEGVVLANIRDMQLELLKHKRFIDMTGNNVNHPNDFFVRCHAQLFSELLIGRK